MFGKYGRHKERLKNIKEIKNVQKKNLTDDYMVGLYNGMEFALAIMENREPVYETNINHHETIDIPEKQRTETGRTIASGTRKLGGKNK